MNAKEKQRLERLEADGWRTGNTEDFLGLTEAEKNMVDLRLALGHEIRMQRQKAGLSQEELGLRIGSDQATISRMEKGGAKVTVDLMLQALFSLGQTTRTVGKVIAHSDVR